MENELHEAMLFLVVMYGIISTVLWPCVIFVRRDLNLANPKFLDEDDLIDLAFCGISILSLPVIVFLAALIPNHVHVPTEFVLFIIMTASIALYFGTHDMFIWSREKWNRRKWKGGPAFWYYTPRERH